jgi:NAD-dependent DNA ligase
MTTSMSTPTRQRIEDLANRIVALRDAYYRGEPLVADAEYDALEDELRGLVATHPELAPDPNPLETVGAPAAESRFAASSSCCARRSPPTTRRIPTSR